MIVFLVNMERTMTKRNIAFLSLVIMISCSILSCKTNSIAKSEAKAKDLAVLDSFYNQDNYKIDVEVAYPFNTAATTQVANVLLRNTGNTANRIDVQGDGNFIKIKNDSVTAYLPFFGERRLNGGDYGGQNSGIQIEEPLRDLTKQIDTKKGKLELSFKAEQKGNGSDKYEIKIEIYPNNRVMVNVTPVYKTFMRYDGRLEDFEEDE